MHNPREVATTIRQAYNGELPPASSVTELQAVDAVVGFAFGAKFNAAGELSGPGGANEALAQYISANFPDKKLFLQEEIAMAMAQVNPGLAAQVHVLPPLKRPGHTYNTAEIAQQAIHAGLGGYAAVAVVAFGPHLLRASKVLEKACRECGTQVVIPDMQGVGDFDAQSSQPWTRSEKAWRKREVPTMLYFAFRNYI